jgi:hypothetical protein
MKRGEATIFLTAIIIFLFYLHLMLVQLQSLAEGELFQFLLNNPPAKVEVIKHIKESKVIAFDYTSSFDVSEILAKQFEATKADAIVNVTVSLKVNVLSYLLNVVTLGLANAKVFEVEGDLVKAPRGLGLLYDQSSENIIYAETIQELMKKVSASDLLSASPKMIIKTENGFALIINN